MNEVLKAKWTRALRSGQYVQGTGQLRTKDNHYCCLGVLCDLLSPAEGTWKEYDHGFRFCLPPSGYNFDSMTSSLSLPFDLSKKFAISPELELMGLRLNDAGFSFEEIATVIENDTLLVNIKEIMDTHSVGRISLQERNAQIRTLIHTSPVTLSETSPL